MSDLETAQMHLDAANRSVLGLLEATNTLARERNAALGEVERLRALASDVVTDYGAKCCDDLTGCACSMARLSRTTRDPA